MFEDNILVTESRSHPRPTHPRQSQTELLRMIPEVTKRKKTSFKRRAAKSVNPSSTNSTTMTFKVGKRSSNKSHYT
jgi:hypothetical protein